MKTTIRLDEQLLTEANRLALESGRTLTAVIEDAVREVVMRRKEAPKAKKIRLTTEGGKGLRPGVCPDNNAALLDIQHSSMDFLQLRDKTFLLFGVANRKSVAWHIGRVLGEAGAKCVYVVQNDTVRQNVAKLLGDEAIHLCDVEHEDQIARLSEELRRQGVTFDGMVHSLAFADFSDGIRPFHETSKKAFLQAVDISCYSLIALSNAMKDLLAPDASVVTISISTTQMASESYGYMAPIKAALDSSLAFLAKSFSRFSHVRFNAVAPGLLKTSASAGIPGYVDAYLYAEQVIPRKEAVRTEEVANTAAFLLSPRSSGINAQRIVIDAGMSINYFDRELVERAMRS